MTTPAQWKKWKENKKIKEKTIAEICSHLEMMAHDPWPDELWPAANVVLLQAIESIKENLYGSGQPKE